MTFLGSEKLQKIKLSPTMLITNQAAKLKATGEDIIRLSAGEPDFNTPDHIKQAGIQAITDNHMSIQLLMVYQV